MKSQFVIGTRGSDLALWQAHHVKSLLEAKGIQCTIHIIKTKGDNIQHLSFDKIEGKGFFTKEIEEALLKNEVDIAVHSHKDLETEEPDGLTIAAVSPRADARDLLLIRKDCIDGNEKFSLKKNAVVGTSSARRKAQLLHYRPDVQPADIRGNVPTRVQKLRDGNFDAILLAQAGVDRLELDLTGFFANTLHSDVFIPAPAQGVLAIQCRSSDAELVNILSGISDEKTRELIRIERTVLNKLQGGCQLPLGLYAERTTDGILAHVSIANAWNAPVKMFTSKGIDPDAIIDDILIRIRS